MISIVTISPYSRRNVLPLLFQCIISQTKQPDEWVIVEGSRNKEDADKNQLEIKKFIDANASFSIVYIAFSKESKLGELRNRGNQSCLGDIIICMDDDDYYPPMRIQHVVERFAEFPLLKLAGCTNMLLYDFKQNQFYQCKGYHKNHSTNNAMAWRKSYLVDHTYDSDKTFGEEASFTNQFTESMIQLHPIHTVITSCHHLNTFDKTNVLQTNYFTTLPDSLLEKIIPLDQFNLYKEICNHL